MKLNEIANSHTEMEELLKHYKIENYTIRPDGTVDVDDWVYLGEQNFTTLPFKFGKVSGKFSCSRCANLTSLEGAPSSVGGSFNCSECPQLTSLEGGPSFVGGNFNCNFCPQLTSLEGFAARIIGTLYCNWSNIKSGGIGLILSGVGTRLYMPTSAPFHIIEKYLRRPADIFECQAELIEAGYEEYAKL